MVTLREVETREAAHGDRVDSLCKWIAETYDPLKKQVATLVEGTKKFQKQAELKKVVLEYYTRRKALVESESKSPIINLN